MDERARKIKEINKKRNERKRRKRKKLLARLFVFFIIVCIITLTVLSLTVFFPITKIVVRNPEPYSAEQIIKASGIIKGQNLILAGKNAEASIVTSLPYISEIDISRKLPGTIYVTAKKAEIAACYKTDKGYLYCDKNTKLLEIKETEAEDIITVVGCKFKNPKVGNLLEFANEDAKNNANLLLNTVKDKDYKVSLINVSDGVNLSFKIENKYLVELGSASQLDSKFAHLDEMLKNVNKDVSGIIDLSVWTSEEPRGIFKQGVIE